MKMADLPSRFVRPLGDDLTPLQSRVLDLVGSGVNTVPEMARQTNASRDGVRRALLALKRRGLTDEVEPSASLPDRVRQPSIWVAL